MGLGACRDNKALAWDHWIVGFLVGVVVVGCGWEVVDSMRRMQAGHPMTPGACIAAWRSRPHTGSTMFRWCKGQTGTGRPLQKREPW
ncbi:hypothetical protein P154DRAFT_289260 [Amniculicola lignicola CBS 123094]|uniref:Uncharacterized protein n=1 Tax=Amniculicola lignicola CBS 123094 TaxID=1392246 RepID=A0A6A5X1T2_9PLEO|nr:hypothetical protein P154DRAFT_289260 [Amniculicola lignicola CBS 123094]